jgi:hypothetical protein
MARGTNREAGPMTDQEIIGNRIAEVFLGKSDKTLLARLNDGESVLVARNSRRLFTSAAKLLNFGVARLVRADRSFLVIAKA